MNDPIQNLSLFYIPNIKLAGYGIKKEIFNGIEAD